MVRSDGLPSDMSATAFTMWSSPREMNRIRIISLRIASKQEVREYAET